MLGVMGLAVGLCLILVVCFIHRMRTETAEQQRREEYEKEHVARAFNEDDELDDEITPKDSDTDQERPARRDSLIPDADTAMSVNSQAVYIIIRDC